MTISSLDLPHHRDCIACPLATTRHNVVPGFGNPAARLMLVGEAPGAEEDAQGKPFVGRSGTLLRDIIDAMPAIKADDFFFTNIFQCRPPGNAVRLTEGSPCPDIWLTAEIQRLKPVVVVAVGKTACDYFRPQDTDMPARWHAAKDSFDEVRRCWVVGMFHPSYALRSGAEAGSEEGNRIVTSMVYSMQRALYYLHAAGWSGGAEQVADLQDTIEEGGPE